MVDYFGTTASFIAVATQVLLASTCAFLACKLLVFFHTYWWRPRRITKMMLKQGVTGPASRFMVGNLAERNKMRKEAVQHDMHGVSHDIVGRLMPDYVQWSQSYGRRFLFWWGAEPRLTLYDLDEIKDLLSSKHVQCLGRSKLQRDGVNDFIGKGLLMANGEAWAHQRRVVAPAFHIEKLKGQVGHMVDCTSKMLEEWDELLFKDGKGSVEIEVGEHMSRLAGDIIARTEFSSSYEKGKIIFAKLNELQRLSTQSGRRTRLHDRSVRKLKMEVEVSLMTIIEARRDAMRVNSSPSYGYDLLGLMLWEIDAAREEQKCFCYTSQQLMDECKTFFFTGHETTSLLLTWTLMLLASNPSWQDRAREETLHLIQGEPTDSDILSKLKVLGMILFESLRLYTPATLLARQAFVDMRVGDLHIPKGLSVWVPVLAIHHDKSIWGEDADEFRPERFGEGVANACKHPMAYMPFSFGPRNCVGQNFAIMEAKVVLSILLSRFRFHLSPHYKHAPVFVLTLKPKHGVPIIVERLNQ